MRDAFENPFGVTKFAYWSGNGNMLREQLASAGVRFREEIIGGDGSFLSLIFYFSPKSNQDITVFVLPYQAGDDVAEDYFFCEGMSEEEAMSDMTRWDNVYRARHIL